MFVSILKLETPAKNEKVVYRTHVIEHAIRELSGRKLAIREEMEHVDNPVPAIVGEASNFKIEGGWLFAWCSIGDPKIEHSVRHGKRLIRTFMMGEFDDTGVLIGIHSMKYLFLTKPYDCSWPNEFCVK